MKLQIYRGFMFLVLFIGLVSFLRYETSANEFANLETTLSSQIRLDSESQLALEIIGHTGGITTDIKVRGNYAITNIGSAISVFDISNRGNPVLLNSSEVLKHDITDIIIDQDLLVVSVVRGGVYLFDISNLPQLEMLSFFPTGLDLAFDLSISGQYLYIAQGSGLRILDIFDPANPFETAHLNIGIVQGVAIDELPSGEKIAYLGAYTKGVKIVDVTDNSNPIIVGTADSTCLAGRVEIDDNHLYLSDSGASGFCGMRIYEIVNSTFLSEVGFYQLPTIGNLQIHQSNAYLAGTGNGLHKVDVSNKTNPTGGTVYSRWLSGVNGFDVVVSENIAFLATSSEAFSSEKQYSGIEIIDLATNSFKGAYDKLGDALNIAIASDYAFVGDGDGGIRIIDISNPSSLSEDHFLDFRGVPMEIEVSGDYLFALVNDLSMDGLYVWNISAPTNPVLVSYLDVNVTEFDNKMLLVEDYMYIRESTSSTFTTVDISDPNNLSRINSIRLADIDFLTSKVVDNYLYAYGNEQLKLIDISKPESPKIINTTFRLGGGIRDLVYESGFIYAISDNKLQIIRVGFDNQFELIDTVSLPSLLHKVYAFNNRLYLLGEKHAFTLDDESDSGYMSVWDISNKSVPVEIEEIKLPGEGSRPELIEYEDLLLVTRSLGGLYLLKMQSQDFDISGRVTTNIGEPLSAIEINYGLGTVLTDIDGFFSISGLARGEYQLSVSPASNYKFVPLTINVSNETSQLPVNFTAIGCLSNRNFNISTNLVGKNSECPLSISPPLLELPFDYSNSTFGQAILGFDSFNEGKGRVTSWFDHTSPNQRLDQKFSSWTGDIYYANTLSGLNSSNCRFSYRCYDGHEGIDFAPLIRDDNEDVYAAAPGVVVKVVDNVEGNCTKECPVPLGNQVWILHEQDTVPLVGFYTIYAHLDYDSINVEKGDILLKESYRSKPIAKMGNTGNSGGVHLHFEVRYDDDLVTYESANVVDVIDPFGWLDSSNLDPWKTDTYGISSTYLWRHPLMSQGSIPISGGELSNPDKTVLLSVPEDTFANGKTLRITDFPTNLEFPDNREYAGVSFLIDLIDNEMDLRSAEKAFINSVDVIISIQSEGDNFENGTLALFKWNDDEEKWIIQPSSFDEDKGVLTSKIHESGRFSVFGNRLSKLYLPIILK